MKIARCYFVPYFLSYASAKYYLNWFTVYSSESYHTNKKDMICQMQPLLMPSSNLKGYTIYCNLL